MRRLLPLLLAIAALLLLAGPAASQEIEAPEPDYPLYIAARILYPVGVVLDVLIARPIESIVTSPGVQKFMGYEEGDFRRPYAASRSRGFRSSEGPAEPDAAGKAARDGSDVRRNFRERRRPSQE